MRDQLLIVKLGADLWAASNITFLAVFFKEKLKGELGELEFYFRKILLHQQKFLVVSGKMDQNEVTKHFSVGNTFAKQQYTLEFFVSIA